MFFKSTLSALALLNGLVASETIAEINGRRFQSGLEGQNVTDVQGIVTAKGPNGFWMRSVKPDDDEITSDSIYVFGESTLNSTSVGETISLDGRIDEYRSKQTTSTSPRSWTQRISRCCPATALLHLS